MARGSGESRALSVTTSIGTSIIVEIDSSKGVREARRTIARAHAEAFEDLGEVDVGALHGYGKFADTVGLWFPVDDTGLKHNMFESLMAQVTTKRGVMAGEAEFNALASPAALTARNRAALASSPLLSPSRVAGDTSSPFPTAVHAPSLLPSAGTPTDPTRRLNMSDVATPAAEAETPKAFAKATDDAKTATGTKRGRDSSKGESNKAAKRTRVEAKQEMAPWEIVEEVAPAPGEEPVKRELSLIHISEPTRPY